MLTKTGQLKIIREKMGLSLKELAMAAGCSHVCIHLIESGKRDGRPDTLKRIEGALGLLSGFLSKWNGVES